MANRVGARGRGRTIVAAVAAAFAAGGCWGGRNYSEATAPRRALPVPAPATGRPTSIRVVTYNVAFARDVAGAIAVLRTEPALRHADIVLLQEMTDGATAAIAAALGMGYVYYPAIHHRRTRQDFGNAVLSRWPVVADAKLILPHRSRYAGTQRTATAVTVRLGGLTLRVYSTHLGTAADIGSAQRREQLEAILADARAHPLAIIGGDMNTGDLAWVTTEGDVAWPTRHVARTTRFGRWDHFVTRGPVRAVPDSVGVAEAGRQASDHAAVWGVFALPAPP